MIGTLLVANRGEIACRVMRTAKRMGMRCVAVFSDADRDALHVALADEAVRIGPAPAAESYLDGAAILNAARRTGAEAIHPGYGFLSENADFAQAAEAAGLIFVGPRPDSIRAMGLKDAAKRLMEAAGVPVVPGFHGEEDDPARLAREAERIGYPVLIKARAGGGGKGMRRVKRAADFADALASARREALAAFGDAHCLVERYVAAPRHVEVQVFGDAHGNLVHLFERDCSLQRRHQKVIEEAPAPGMTAELRAVMGEAAVRAARAVNYRGAGTVEFILDASEGLRPDRFFFMEMNTRLQVEHPVTELVTGLDLVELQLRVAMGEHLPIGQDDVRLSGHAVEARLYAEDPAAGFLPSTGRLSTLRFPEGNVRVETGVREGDRVTPHYDPMIAKLVVHGATRAEAFRRLRAALAETRIAGPATNLGVLARLAADPDVLSGMLDTGLIERRGEALTAPARVEADEVLALAALACLGHLEPVPDAIGWRDPFDALRSFRAWGRARQVALLQDETGERREVVVHTDETDDFDVALPDGSACFGICRREADGRVVFERDGRRRSALVARDADGITIFLGSEAHRFTFWREAASGDTVAAAASDRIVAPMPGLVRLVAESGAAVAKGDVLAVLEAMKMEHALRSPRDGRVATVSVSLGDAVESGAVLLTLAEEVP
ncbi:acetyl/propionyl/methylcrotonyl-CoA carboxylase subunit alpha [Antarcticirhabdus aurantiaca]|uniref:ATP-grasp domain-containing protein n=1 Tax=Antarcticirhabdus aurantiaca TaxID=2606717 RepID=A0ACD4NNX4_9HYPH|nr:biotin carboxylase N-terminal domain-containing protein [Antarcticirhabdus aurantiaca]WAJ28599.1 ATP-grasp domain-containing protein [Jeongeuplla avenae]